MDDIDKRRRRDFEDLQNEIADRDTGRMPRFGVGAARERALRDKKHKERAYRDALDRMLAEDAEYRALYEDLGDRLGIAEREADAEIEHVHGRLLEAENHLSAMAAAAARGPDGQLVFRYADGRVVDAKDAPVAPEIADGIIWPPGAPSAEAYFAGKAQERALRDALERWQGYRTETLGDIRDRYEDRNTPISKDEMREALEAIEENRPTAASPDTSVSQAATLSTAPQSFPDLN